MDTQLYLKKVDEDIILTCHMNNKQAIHIYEKMGFKDTGERDEDEVIMKMTL